MASTEIRDRRRVLRDWHLLVRQMVQMKNRISGLLMETGVSYEKKRLYTQRYFEEVVWNHPEVSAHIRPLLRVSRESILQCRKTEYALRKSLQHDRARVSSDGTADLDRLGRGLTRRVACRVLRRKGCTPQTSTLQTNSDDGLAWRWPRPPSPTD